MNSVLLPDGIHIEDGSDSVVEEVSGDDAASGIIVNNDICRYYQQRKPKRQQYAAATVLRTNDFLKGRPRVHVPTGRYVAPKLESGEEVDEGPPRLADPDGSYATPSLRPHFRIYADATLRKADEIFQGQASTSRSEEIVAEDETVHQMTDEGVAGEELEHILEEESHVMDEQQQMETLEPKHEMYYDAGGEEQSMRGDEYEEEWYANHAIDFPEACEIVLGNIPVADNKVCKSTPQGYRGVGTVIVDWGDGDRQAVGQDGLGSWGKPSGRTRFYQMNLKTNKYVCVSDSRGQIQKGAPYDVKCQLRKYEHPATTIVDDGANRFIKKVISCISNDNEPVSRLAVITYEWVGTPFEFTYTAERRRVPPPPRPPQGTRSWEAASIQSALFSSFPSTCTAVMGDCPLYAMGAIQFQDVAAIIMGGTIVDDSKICDRIPQRFRESGTFVIDVHSLGSEHEMRRDDNGQWGKPAGNSRHVYYRYDGVNATRLDRSGKLEPGARAEGSYDLQILCKRYEHPLTSNRFVRKIYTGRSPVNGEYHETLQLAVITYFWKGDPIPFEIPQPQRKVRVHNASDIEVYKRRCNDDVPFDEEDAMIMTEGGDMYMEEHVDQSALIDEHIPDRMMEPQPPPGKRTKLDEPSTSMAGERQTMQQGAGGLPSQEDVQCAKMALENQERFSMLLDRFESVAEKMERMTEMQLNMMWRTRQYEESRERPEGEVQYVEEEEEVYEVEGEG